MFASIIYGVMFPLVVEKIFPKTDSTPNSACVDHALIYLCTIDIVCDKAIMDESYNYFTS